MPSAGSTYATIPGYAEGSVTNWALFIEFSYKGESSQKVIFSNLDTPNDVSLLLENAAGDYSLYLNESSLGAVNIGYSSTLGGGIARFLLVCNNSNVTAYRWTHLGAYPIESSDVLGRAPKAFPGFFWFGTTVGTLNLRNGGVSRSIFIKRAITARELNLLMIAPDSDEYKTIPNLEFDINFGDVFLNMGNYYARDSTTNNRHAQLFNWSTAATPTRYESKGKPERSKALRLTNTSNQYVSIPSFTPTAEKGYTQIIGFCLDSDRPFLAGFEGLFGKPTGAKTKRLYGDASAYTINLLDVRTHQWNFKKMNRPNFVVWTDSLKPSSTRYHNGFSPSENVGGGSIAGYNELAGDLLIGKDPNGGDELNGYLFFTGIWKGVLTQSQIIDIIDNGLSGNAAPSLMSDCQLYLNFEEIINDAGTYKIKDWSPQNRTVILNNYTINEITPGDPAYKLFDLDSLR
jgi:hypothetical protein